MYIVKSRREKERGNANMKLVNLRPRPPSSSIVLNLSLYGFSPSFFFYISVSFSIFFYIKKKKKMRGRPHARRPSVKSPPPFSLFAIFQLCIQNAANNIFLQQFAIFLFKTSCNLVSSSSIVMKSETFPYYDIQCNVFLSRILLRNIT